jgi:hypothetical protein
LALLEHHSTGTCGLLTERTRRQLARARSRPARHMHAAVPGELACLDTSDIGKLKNATAGFLRAILAPLYRRAGWPLRRVLPDGGSEFKGPFEETCRALGIRPTRTQPRHAWTHGFTERLQGPSLHEHWRIEFRRRSFTSRAAMQQSLDAVMRFYNAQRPHQGDRVRGHTPAELF